MADDTSRPGGPSSDERPPRRRPRGTQAENDTTRGELEEALGEPVSFSSLQDAGNEDADIEELRRQFERLDAQRQSHEMASPGGSAEETSETDDRLKAFEELRRLASAEQSEAPSPPKPGTTGPPPSTTPRSESSAAEPESSEWHNAFQRLAAERGDIDDREAPSQPDQPFLSESPHSGPGAVAQEPPRAAPASPETAARRADFEELRRQAAAADAGVAPPPPEPSSPEVSARNADFEELRRQATAADAGVAPPPPEPAPPEASARSTDFEELRRQAAAADAGEASPQREPASPESEARNSDFEQLVRQAAGGEMGDVGTQAGPISQDDQEQEEGSDVATGLPADEPILDEDAPDDYEAESALGPEPVSSDGASKAEKSLRAVQRLVSLTAAGGAAAGSAAGVPARRGWDYVRKKRAEARDVTALSFEHGSMKVLVVRDLEVIDYRVVPANPRLFREGLVSDAPRMAALLQRALTDLEGNHHRGVAAVPGYQTSLRRLELPGARGMDPKVIIPREAQRHMGVSLENSFLTWQRLPGTRTTSNWLVVSASNRSISSLSQTLQSAGLPLRALELRPFALARAANEPDAVIAWAADDGCDAVVVRDWVPVTHQAAYWGTGTLVEPSDLVNRLTEVLEATIVSHDTENPELTVPDDAPVFITGSPLAGDGRTAQRVASNLGRTAAEPFFPMNLPPDFPADDLFVNIGLALWERKGG